MKNERMKGRMGEGENGRRGDRRRETGEWNERMKE
jgi:hypothetical protein